MAMAAADGAIEITGCAKASTRLDIFVRKAGGELTPLGSTQSLPTTDPFIQPTPIGDKSPFAFRTRIAAGTGYTFEVRVTGPASDLVLKDMVSGKSYGFGSDDSRPGSQVTVEPVTVTPNP
jgi:hypothetical protein